MNRFPLKRELKTAIVISQKIFESECFFTNYLKALTEHLHLDWKYDSMYSICQLPVQYDFGEIPSH